MVVDASALIEVLLQSPSAPLIEERILGSGQVLHAPHLVDLEVMQVLRRYEAKGTLTRDRSRAALSVFLAFPMRRWAHAPLVPRIWDLRNNLTAYDASYIALAEAVDEPLITCDRALATAPGHRARIELM